MSALKKEGLVKKIAQEMSLREDIVAEMLECLVDIAVEEIANTGEFRIHRLLSVSTVHYKGYEGGKGTVPPHDRLKVRLSEGVHRLFKHRSAQGVEVNRHNWKELLQELGRGAHGKRAASEGRGQGDFYNPLLDDD